MTAKKPRSNSKAVLEALRWQIVRGLPDLPAEEKLAWYQIWFELRDDATTKVSVELKELAQFQGTSIRSAGRYIAGLARAGLLKVQSRKSKPPASCVLELLDPVGLAPMQVPRPSAMLMLLPKGGGSEERWLRVQRSALRGVVKLGWLYLWHVIAGGTANVLCDVSLSEMAIDQGVDARSPKRLIEKLAKQRLLQIKGAKGVVWNVILTDPTRYELAPRKRAKRKLVSAPTTVPSLASEIPEWDRTTGELVFRGAIVKRITKLLQAKHAIQVLDVFQLEGWPNRIDDPLPGGADRDRLKNVLKGLNAGLGVIRFERDGTGKGIRWILT